jgi:P27 family predicted phage terminase small subunit
VGSRGPAPTPTKLKLLRGETRASRVNRAEPEPGGSPHMPPGMSDASKRVWRRIIRDYGRTGVITAADADVLRAYCDAVVRYVQADTALQASGPLSRGARHGDVVRNPLHQIVRDNATLVRGFARELGLTPSARSGVAGTPRAEIDPMEGFLNGRRRTG